MKIQKMKKQNNKSENSEEHTIINKSQNKFEF